MLRPAYWLADAVVKLVLGSPLHFLFSWQFIVLEFTGLKTGHKYRIGVNYLRRGGTLHCMSHRKRLWWRNLRGGREITVLYRGRRRPATTHVEENDLAAIGAGLNERELPRRLLYRARAENSVLIKVELAGS
jgi:hypothetical protein